MIKAIIFDCFGVLTIDHWRAFLDALPEDVDVGRARELNQQYAKGLIDRKAFLSQVSDLTGHQPQEIESVLWDEIVKNTALLRYVSQLRQRGYSIGLLSNIATNWVRETLLTPDEQSLFDDMIFSFEVGMAKPEPQIFDLVCDRLEVDNKHAVLVDDVDGYCQAARRRGMQAVVYEDFAQMKRELEQLLASY